MKDAIISEYLEMKKKSGVAQPEGNACVMEVTSKCRFRYFVVHLNYQRREDKVHMVAEFPLHILRGEYEYLSKELAGLNEELEDNEAFTLRFVDNRLCYERIMDVPDTIAELDNQIHEILADRTSNVSEYIMDCVCKANYKYYERMRREERQKERDNDADEHSSEDKGSFFREILRFMGLFND